MAIALENHMSIIWFEHVNWQETKARKSICVVNLASKTRASKFSPWSLAPGTQEAECSSSRRMPWGIPSNTLPTRARYNRPRLATNHSASPWHQQLRTGTKPYVRCGWLGAGAGAWANRGKQTLTAEHSLNKPSQEQMKRWVDADVREIHGGRAVGWCPTYLESPLRELPPIWRLRWRQEDFTARRVRR